MKFFKREEINTGRQIEFDIAKAICIIGMVFVHCFEELPLVDATLNSSVYYTFVTVLDAIFGAGTFMICLGIGLSFTKKNKPNDFIKRGLIIFALGYVLNIFRFVIPYFAYYASGGFEYLFGALLSCFLYTDIMQFAGLAFIAFGLLKKMKLPDFVIAIIAVALSITGTFVRFIEINDSFLAEILGLFIGTTNAVSEYFAPFAFISWFVLVIFGYFYGMFIRRIKKIERFYAISTIVAATVLIPYMILAIPNRYGMMSGDLKYYFQMTSWETLIIIAGAVFAFGIYHYISKLFTEGMKKIVISLSVNINKTYCTHWILIGIVGVFLWTFVPDGIKTYVVLLTAFGIYLFSSVFAEVLRRTIKKIKEKKNASKVNS